MFSLVARSFIRVYQVALSPLLHALTGAGSGCRFEPTCSHYAMESFREWGWPRALRLSVGRVLRCHPWSSGGFDPVPRAIGNSLHRSTR